jgi:membrane fusion protein (multidrug efflux system)
MTAWMRHLAVISVLGAACSQAPEQAEAPEKTVAPPVKVTTVAAEAAHVPDSVRFLGTLVPDKTARLAADANGVVTAMHVERGQPVSEGDLIAEVDTRMASLSATASEAQVALAKAQQSMADSDCGRIDALFAGGAVAQAQVDRAKAQCEAQARAVDAAKAQARIAETTLGKMKIRAPFSGVVAERLVQRGEFVSAASGVVNLVSINPIRVSFPVPERDLPAIAEGGTVRVVVAAAGGVPIEGTVLRLSPIARESTRDLIVEARLPNDAGALRAGLTAEVTVVKGERDAVSVPTTAVLADDTVHRLFVVRDGKAVERLVHIDLELDGRLVVSPGIAVGDLVIDNPAGLHDGALVE